MSNGYRNGAFALGLAVGAGLVLNLVLWLDYRAQDEKHQYAKGTNTPDQSQIGQSWDGFIGTFVSPSDTLAQWIMAFFTIAATVVLIFTLRSANKTNIAAVNASTAALEANQLMRDEQRPWLFFELRKPPTLYVKPNGDRGIGFAGGVWNYGKQPAFRVRIFQYIENISGLEQAKAVAANFVQNPEIGEEVLSNTILFPDADQQVDLSDMDAGAILERKDNFAVFLLVLYDSHSTMATGYDLKVYLGAAPNIQDLPLEPMDLAEVIQLRDSG